MKTYARTNTFTVLTAVCAMAFATAKVLLFTSCANISPQAVRIYKTASMQTAQPQQEREIMTQADINELIRQGDAAFSRKDYAEAKGLYYTVLLTDSDPDAELLVSYGDCLANLQRYQDAITVFYMALDKDPYNETANNNIAICRENIAAQERWQQAEYERQQREQEERKRQYWENTMAILNALSQAASAYSSAYSGGSSDYSGGGSSGGQSASSSGSSSSSSRYEQDCLVCNGSGDCPRCNGTGWADNGQYIGREARAKCTSCYGSIGSGKCYSCGGSGKKR